MLMLILSFSPVHSPRSVCGCFRHSQEYLERSRFMLILEFHVLLSNICTEMPLLCAMQDMSLSSVPFLLRESSKNHITVTWILKYER